MRTLLAVTVASSIVVLSVACGGDTKASPTTSAAAGASVAVSATAPPSPTARMQPVVTPESSATPPTSQPAGETVEVTGIVGGVNLSGNAIEIRRLQGAAVTQVSVDSRTVIRKAGGGTLGFKEIRTSDRIIARGTLNDRRDALIATEITVQDVVPGSQPGG
jgi:hypothetical protein